MDETQAHLQRRPLRRGLGRTAAFSLLGLVLVVVALGSVFGLGAEAPPPQQPPEVVVEKFYEYISESKIRGGTMLVREAFKLTSGDQSRFGQAKFLEVINRYPAGFNAKIVSTDIQGVHAEVTIAYEMASAFGGSYTVNAVIPLNVDADSNAWKVDFKGDTDDQNLDTIKRDYTSRQPSLTASSNVKGVNE